MNDEGRDLTKEELEEMKKAKGYSNSTIIAGPDDSYDSYGSYIAHDLENDLDAALVLFIVGDIIVVILSIFLAWLGFSSIRHIVGWVGVALFVLAVIGTNIRFFPSKKKDNPILKGNRETKVIIGTIIALHITPFGIGSLICYLNATQGIRDIKKLTFYRVCHNAKEFKDLLEALNYDLEKEKISYDDYNLSVYELKSDLNQYVASLDNKVKVVEERITKGLASKKELEITIKFIQDEKDLAYEIFHPEVIKEKEAEALRKNEELKKKMPSLIKELEANVSILSEEKKAHFNTFKEYYEKKIYTMEEYYSRLKALFENDEEY